LLQEINNDLITQGNSQTLHAKPRLLEQVLAHLRKLDNSIFENIEKIITQNINNYDIFYI